MPHKIESGNTVKGINAKDLLKPSKLTFGMLKKGRKTEPNKSANNNDFLGVLRD
jgi:hypothetical protein